MDWLAAFKQRGGVPTDFIGKAVVIYCSSGRGGGVFEDVKIGFSNFVVGRKVETEPWRRGSGSDVIGWFGINEIRQMYVFDDIEAAGLAYEPEGP